MYGKSFGLMVVAVLAALPAHAEKKCQLQRYAELPVTMVGTRPLITGTINGKTARFLADSGAFYSMLSRETVDNYQLKVSPMAGSVAVRGTGGTETMGITNVAQFSLTGLGGGSIIKDIQFLVGDNSLGRDGAGIIGQNILGNADTEFDLANGFIRLFHSKDCSDRSLAYWAGDTLVAEIEFDNRSPHKPQLIGRAKINGKKIRIMFDTGAWRSLLSLDAAARAGIKPEDDTVVAGGIGHGIGKHTNESWIARFDSLDLGGEVIKNARLRMSDFSLSDTTDMLLGADFFLSHRIYVAANQHKLYFTYNGGQVFDLRPNNSARNVQAAASPTPSPATAPKSEMPDQAAPTPAPTPAPSPTTEPTAAIAHDTPSSAADFKRRGAASVGRQDYLSAIADFDQAIKLDGADPENYYQRGAARLQNRQPVLAINDFDAALKLKPDYVDALMARGATRLARRNLAGGRADLDAASNLAPKDAALQLQIAQTFVSAGSYDEAIARLDTWVNANPKDDRVVAALNERCTARAMAGKELDLALADCNAALKKGPRNSQIFDIRAFVYLRIGDFDKAIADYKASLKLQPKKAWSLYGLGVAEIRKGSKGDGDKDIQAAIAINPNVAESYRRIGVAP